jgi:hypothetical protein
MAIRQHWWAIETYLVFGLSSFRESRISRRSYREFELFLRAFSPIECRYDLFWCPILYMAFKDAEELEPYHPKLWHLLQIDFSRRSSYQVL